MDWPWIADNRTNAVERNEILVRLRERIVRFAASRLMRDAAEDLAQEVLLVLHEKYATLEDPVGHRRVTVDLSECPYLTLWSDGGGTMVCVEPCWGLPDHHEQRPFEQKLGIQEIPPGGTLQRSFTVTAVVT